MKSLPEFSLEDYASLLRSLRSAGYDLLPARYVAERGATGEKARAYLRHDIDLFLTGVDEFARREADEGVSATYYILLSQHYNPKSSSNRKVLLNLAAMGHELGLHYDLVEYPGERERAMDYLRSEIRFLEDLTGTTIRDIAMHQPHLGHEDWFLNVHGLVNPANPEFHKDLQYVSDSCRAWRDESLLNCFLPGKPERLLLTTHPELWLDGSIRDRYQYLDSVLSMRGTTEARRYFDEEVRGIWQRHPAPAAHDARVAAQESPAGVE